MSLRRPSVAQCRATCGDLLSLYRKAIVHGYCHQKAVIGTSAEEQLYERIGLDFELLDSGCCGLAGSFGFERSHHDISVEIGERRLLPSVRDAAAEELVIADGFSCKHQVAELSGRRALHTAQVIKMALEQGPEGPWGGQPESDYPDLVQTGHGRVREALILGAAATALAGLALGARR